ncbi:MAG TPA: hypothetical protein VF704_11475 [Allosphingosinicella sp.]|jgi:hypothetical protein
MTKTLSSPLGRAGSVAAAVAVALGLFCIWNGVTMLLVPARWYWAVPGVPLTGGYNAHFIRDIGIVYALTGGGLIWGAASAARRPMLWGLAAGWLTGHAGFHLVEVAVGICGPDAIPRDFLAVTVPGLTALALALARAHGPHPTVTTAAAASS